LEVYGKLQRSLAHATMAAAHGSVTRPWKEVHLEIAAAPDEKTCATKLRVVPVSGAPLDVSPTAPILAAAREIWNLRDSGITPDWKIMKLTITGEGRCTVSFAYGD
jgi:hypothetical protein